MMMDENTSRNIQSIQFVGILCVCIFEPIFLDLPGEFTQGYIQMFMLQMEFISMLDRIIAAF